MEKYIHREDLALFKKPLAEPHGDAEREVLLKLPMDEEAKEPPILSSSATQHPPCAKCGLPMFACVELVDDEFMERAFECHCGYTLTVRLPVSTQ